MLQEFTIEHREPELIAMALRQAIGWGTPVRGLYVCRTAPVTPAGKLRVVWSGNVTTIGAGTRTSTGAEAERFIGPEPGRGNANNFARRGGGERVF